MDAPFLNAYGLEIRFEAPVDANSLIGRDTISLPIADLTGKTILVTGSAGFIGLLLCPAIRERGGEVIEFDLSRGDVLRLDDLRAFESDVDHAVHLAANKHAPLSEDHPAEVARLNIEGTANVCEVFGSKVILGPRARRRTLSARTGRRSSSLRGSSSTPGALS